MRKPKFHEYAPNLSVFKKACDTLKSLKITTLERFSFPMLDRTGGLTAPVKKEPLLEQVVLEVGTRNTSGSQKQLNSSWQKKLELDLKF